MAQKQKSQNKKDTFMDYVSTASFEEHTDAHSSKGGDGSSSKSAMTPEAEQAITASLDRVLKRFDARR
jgi:hypothetical protein